MKIASARRSDPLWTPSDFDHRGQELRVELGSGCLAQIAHHLVVEDALASAGDRSAASLHFVDQLTAADASELRALLSEPGPGLITPILLVTMVGLLGFAVGPPRSG